MRCHFVPQSYLKRFTNFNGKLECFDHSRQYDSTKPISVARHAANIKDWYVLRDPQETEFVEINKKSIENIYKDLYEDKLPSALDSLQDKNLDHKSREIIACFMANQIYRHPQSRRYYKNAKKDAPGFTPNPSQWNLSLLSGFVSDQLEINVLESILINSQWQLIRNRTNVPFMTSDSPICYIAPMKNIKGMRADFSDEIIKSNLPDHEKAIRSNGFSLSLSPEFGLYVNPTAKMETISYDSAYHDRKKVIEWNDFIFMFSLSTIYTVNKKSSEWYNRRFTEGKISLYPFEFEECYGLSDFN